MSRQSKRVPVGPLVSGGTINTDEAQRLVPGTGVPFGQSVCPRSTHGAEGEPFASTFQSKFSGRVRIAFAIDVIQDWNLGGTERQLTSIVRALDPQCFEPVILVLQPSPGTKAKDVGCPVHVINKNGERSRWRTLYKLIRVFRHFRPHIVQTFFIDGTFYGTTAAWLARVPVIVQSRRNAGYWEKPYHTFALRILNRAVDSWQCNSLCVADRLKTVEGISPERILILRNSIDLSRFSPVNDAQRLATRRDLGLPLGAPIIVSVSTLRPIKGIPTIIEAAARLRTHLPKVHFLIVGEGSQRGELTEQIKRSQLAETVRLAGAQEDVRPWLAAADIGLLASQSESSSNALMEYMAMGLPAVVSDIPANRELVEGVYFPVGNAAELADRILWLWNFPDVRREMSDQYRQIAIRYGGVSFAEKVRDYYFKLASEKSLS